MNGMLPHVAPYDSSMAPRPAPLPYTPLRGLQSGSAQQPGRVPEWFRDSPAKRVTWVRFPPRPQAPLHRATGREALPTEGLPHRFHPAHRPPFARICSGHPPGRSGRHRPGDDPTRCCSSSLRLSFTARKPAPLAHAPYPYDDPPKRSQPAGASGNSPRDPQLTPGGRDKPSLGGLRHCGMQTLVDTTRPVAESNLSLVKHLGGFSRWLSRWLSLWFWPHLPGWRSHQPLVGESEEAATVRSWETALAIGAAVEKAIADAAQQAPRTPAIRRHVLLAMARLHLLGNIPGRAVIPGSTYASRLASWLRWTQYSCLVRQLFDVVQRGTRPAPRQRLTPSGGRRTA